MPASSIGSIGPYVPGGRLGQIVGRRTVARTGAGEEVVALSIRPNQPVDADAPLPGARPSGPPVSRPPVAERALPARTAVDSAPTGTTGHRGPEAPTAARTPDRLSSGDKAALTRLRQRDAQVRQEEQAHAAAAGDLAGAIEYTYRLGPDGRRYAVGGSVPIRGRFLNGESTDAARLGARLSAAGQAATNPSGADLATAREGYRLSAKGARARAPVARGRTFDVSV